MMTLIEGDPGEGKSFLAMDLAARISAGGTLPDKKTIAPGYVHYISAEDHASYTIRPRIDRMGGDPKRVRVLSSDLVFDEKGLDQLRGELDENNPVAIIIDPLVSFIPEKTDIHRSNSIRQVLGGLNEIAEDYNSALILIRHLTKKQHDKAIYQGSGSMDFIGVARSALRVAKHPDHTDQTIVAHLKYNVGPKGKSWAFQLKQNRNQEIPTVEWLGAIDLTIDDLTASTLQKPRNRKLDAKAFLERELGDGPRKAEKIMARAQQEGIAERTLKRAKSDLDLESKQRKGKWIWSLPSE